MSTPSAPPLLAADDELAKVRDLVQRHVVYDREGYRWRVEHDVEDPQGRVFIQLQHWRPDAVTGEMKWGGGGKRYLSSFMTPSEIARQALGLALGYEEHEVREFFKYRPTLDAEPRAIFGPHIAIDSLWDVADELDVRP
jgi:hypothetical protein